MAFSPRKIRLPQRPANDMAMRAAQPVAWVVRVPTVKPKRQHHWLIGAIFGVVIMLGLVWALSGIKGDVLRQASTVIAHAPAVFDIQVADAPPPETVQPVEPEAKEAVVESPAPFALEIHTVSDEATSGLSANTARHNLRQAILFDRAGDRAKALNYYQKILQQQDWPHDMDIKAIQQRANYLETLTAR